MFYAAAAGVWVAPHAHRIGLLAAALATVVVGYVFGPEFWHADLGPIPLTLDRLMLIGVAALFAWHWRAGRLRASSLGPGDWALAALLAWLSGSAALSHGGEPASDAPPLWRLAMGFWAPVLLYLAARQSPVGPRAARGLLATLLALGVYLSATAVAEAAGAWSLVFPRYLADPDLGLHFGRSRGPALNSVSLGLFLTASFWAAWRLAPLVGPRLRPAVYAAMPAMAIGVVLTFTRSAWMGLAASALAMLAVELPGRLRLPVLGGLSALGLVAAAGLWQSVVYLEREDSGGVSKHSVQQRAAFAYVSWKMFRDHPIGGVGFGRFYDEKLPYLADRSQPFELDSLRGLHHHSTFLSLLTETGMPGLALYAAVLLGLLSSAWGLSQSPSATPHERAAGALALGVMTAYLPSAVFHEMTLLHCDQWLVMLCSGVAVGARRRVMDRGAAAVAARALAIPNPPAVLAPAR